MGKTPPRPAARRRPVNSAELRNWYLERNLFGEGATLRDVAQHFGRSPDQVKRLSAKEQWPAQLRERQEAEAERRHREVCRRKEIDAVEERLEMLADRDLGRAVLRRKLEHYARHPEQLSPSEAIKLAEWVERQPGTSGGATSTAGADQCPPGSCESTPERGEGLPRACPSEITLGGNWDAKGLDSCE